MMAWDSARTIVRAPAPRSGGGRRSRADGAAGWAYPVDGLSILTGRVGLVGQGGSGGSGRAERRGPPPTPEREVFSRASRSAGWTAALFSSLSAGDAGSATFSLAARDDRGARFQQLGGGRHAGRRRASRCSPTTRTPARGCRQRGGTLRTSRAATSRSSARRWRAGGGAGVQPSIAWGATNVAAGTSRSCIASGLMPPQFCLSRGAQEPITVVP